MMKKSRVSNIDGIKNYGFYIICMQMVRVDRSRVPITITFPGQKRAATVWETTPLDIAKEISRLSERVVIAKV